MTATQQIETTQAALLPTVQRLVLTGFMGAGKTSVGRLLAQTLGWEFLDLDQHLEARSGSSVGDLFAQRGEAHFRRLESSALANALAPSKTVLALGGGTPELLINRLLLEQTPGTVIIFLEAPFDVLFDRCMLQSFASPEHSRPILHDPAAAAARFAARQPLYRRLASVSVPVAEGTPQQIASRLLLAVSKLR